MTVAAAFGAACSVARDKWLSNGQHIVHLMRLAGRSLCIMHMQAATPVGYSAL